MILIGFVLLTTIGLGVFFFLNKDKESFEEETTPIKEEQKEPEKKTIEVKPLLYKVTKDGSDNVVYLFGSIHVADDRAYPMKAEIMQAYNESDYLAVEFDMISYQSDLIAQQKDMKLLMCDQGMTLKDYLSKGTYEKTIKYLKDNNSYNSTYEMFKPVLIYSLVSNVANTKSGLDAEKGIDMYFLKLAHDNKKEILEVETSSYQYQVLTGFSNEFYDFLIRNSITFESLMVSNVKSLYEAWLAGDASKLGSTFESDNVGEGEEETKSLLDEYAVFNDRLINQRNKNMFITVENYFKENKKTFVVVGAGHIVGSTGLATSFTKAGYKVEIVNYK